MVETNLGFSYFSFLSLSYFVIAINILRLCVSGPYDDIQIIIRIVAGVVKCDRDNVVADNVELVPLILLYLELLFH